MRQLGRDAYSLSQAPLIPRLNRLERLQHSHYEVGHLRQSELLANTNPWTTRKGQVIPTARTSALNSRDDEWIIDDKKGSNSPRATILPTFRAKLVGIFTPDVLSPMGDVHGPTYECPLRNEHGGFAVGPTANWEGGISCCAARHGRNCRVQPQNFGHRRQLLERPFKLGITHSPSTPC